MRNTLRKLGAAAVLLGFFTVGFAGPTGSCIVCKGWSAYTGDPCTPGARLSSTIVGTCDTAIGCYTIYRVKYVCQEVQYGFTYRYEYSYQLGFVCTDDLCY